MLEYPEHWDELEVMLHELEQKEILKSKNKTWKSQ